MARTPIIFSQRQLLDSQHTLGKALREGAATLEETQVYIGLNDKDTREQLLETSRYTSILKTVCRSFGVAFSLCIVEGGYIHDDGEYTEETSIVLTFIDVPAATVNKIAGELCTLFHQESVLITTDRVRVRTVRQEL